MAKTTVRTAKAEGTYRCSYDQRGRYFMAGDNLEPCPCGSGQWEFLARDQMGLMVVIVGRRGPDFAAIIMCEPPACGMVLNLRAEGQLVPKFTGRFRITNIGHTYWNGDQVRITVKQVGDAFDESEPIHDMVFLADLGRPVSDTGRRKY